VEVKDVGDEKRVANFLLAVNRRTRDGGADFLNVAVWDRQADLCGKYLSKGQRVGIDGYLRTRSWEEDGKRRRDVDVVARSVEFLSPPSEASAGSSGEVVPFEAAVA
jgi:single-strand DNA-binding protein